jgi:hypothetical protein
VIWPLAPTKLGLPNFSSGGAVYETDGLEFETKKFEVNTTKFQYKSFDSLTRGYPNYRSRILVGN